ncbi:RNA polymerase sigma factor CnrH [Novipirellula artificiosorum]|uniref:RNA polymerase sigma factor CnrH n=2 Tax=Novipirellula artificiosorum TaxID=2528016 RepID=A0A5C6DZT7_9BACT|nr:RNA polymerase sigma factor CnrH [Novipirellula artificiosorum]
MLERARGGDPAAWRRLAQVYGPIVYGWARRCGCQSADAADVMQETFAAVANAIHRFDDQRDQATFRGWLWTITRNKLRDRARNQGQVEAAGGTDAQLAMQQVPSPEITEGDEPPSHQQSDAAIARRRTLELLRDGFEPRSWKMFWETTIEGREPIDVAEEMGVSKWAVYKARARVLQRLQEEMEGLLEFRL